MNDYRMLKFLRRWRRGKRLSDRLKLLHELPQNAVCAEIGVWKGKFSESIVEQTRPRELHLIDPWQFKGNFPDRLYGGKVAKDQSDMDRIYEDVRRKFAGNANVVFHRGTSVEVLEGVADNYFDWIYIDGDHSYEAVAKDLDVSLRKVRRGGFITGDDLNWRRHEGMPVRRAVEEFAAKHSLVVEEIGSQFLIRL